MSTIPKRLLISLGEPAGIAYDIAIQLAQRSQPIEWIAIGCEATLRQRAALLKQPIKIISWNSHDTQIHSEPGNIPFINIPVSETVIPGKLNSNNASHVLSVLNQANTLCQQKKVDALLTLPVHKGILNTAGFSFSGHTEFLRDACQSSMTVMLFECETFRVALASTHLAIKDVPAYLTQKKLAEVLNCLLREFKQKYQIDSPTIHVCGLNPHAGEQGYLGREEIEIIEPVIKQFQTQNYSVRGCFSADTAFTPDSLNHCDCILAMYHDQALPVVKFASFGNAVNVTLGLPYWRISVDHGTALDKAGTGLARSDSAQHAIHWISALFNRQKK